MQWPAREVRDPARVREVPLVTELFKVQSDYLFRDEPRELLDNRKRQMFRPV